VNSSVVGSSVQGQPVVYVSAFIVIVLVAFVRPWAESLVTIAHEGGHMIMTVLVGRRLRYFHIDESNDITTQSSGATTWEAPGTGLSEVLIWATGYLTPPLVGLVSVNLVLAGKAWSLLVAAAVLLFAAYLKARDRFTMVVVLLVLAGVGWVAFWGKANLQAGVAVALVWLMLIGGVTTLQGQGWGVDGSDAAKLSSSTWIPAFFWVALFGFVAVLALLIGTRRLLGI
jgi:hypothetical protein